MTRRDASRLLAFGGLGWMWACTGAPASTGLPAAPPGAGLEPLLERHRAKHGLPGLAASVVRGGAVAASGVSGVRRRGAPDRIEPDDRFHIASCTKSMTAMLAAVAVHEGRLAWTTTLAEGLPALAGKVRPEYRSATLERMLAHAARMPAYTGPDPRTVERMRALTGTHAAQRLAFLEQVLGAEGPNTATGDGAYSNVGYAAAGALVERAGGATWEELLHRQIARPLGLTTIGFGYPATAKAPDQPRGHAGSDELPLDGSRDLAVCLWPAGAVHCSIGDLGRYAADHLNGLRGRRALLPQAIYRRLHRPLGGGDQGFTLGWGVRRDERWGVTHFGAGSGGWFFVRIVIVPEHDAAVVAAANSGQAAGATRELISELLDEFAPDRA